VRSYSVGSKIMSLDLRNEVWARDIDLGLLMIKVVILVLMWMRLYRKFIS
jgi:hypothetical protein